MTQVLPNVFQEGQPASPSRMNAIADALGAAFAAMREDTMAARRGQVSSRERLGQVERRPLTSTPTSPS